MQYLSSPNSTLSSGRVCTQFAAFPISRCQPFSLIFLFTPFSLFYSKFLTGKIKAFRLSWSTLLDSRSLCAIAVHRSLISPISAFTQVHKNRFDFSSPTTLHLTELDYATKHLSRGRSLNIIARKHLEIFFFNNNHKVTLPDTKRQTRRSIVKILAK